MRVLYITDSLKQRFGVTSVIMSYLGHFDYSRIQVDLLVYEDSEENMIEKAKSFGAKVFFMPRLSIRNIKGFKNFYKAFFIANKYDIVHSHFNQIDGIVFPIARKCGVKKCISHSHNTKLSDNRLKAIRNRLMCLNIYSNADICAACSVAAGVSLFGRRFKNGNKSAVINNAIECERFEYNQDIRNRVRKEFGLTNEVVLGNVGSMKPQKNQQFLLDVFASIKQHSITRQYKLMIVGDGDLKELLIKKAKELDICQDVIFTGSRSDVPDLMQAMDMFLLPSLYEGLGIVLIEAQVSGMMCCVSSVVPKDVCITPNVKFLSIDKGTDIWVKAICNENLDRYLNGVRDCIENKYEISTAAKNLEIFYRKIVGE